MKENFWGIIGIPFYERNFWGYSRMRVGATNVTNRLARAANHY
jgi:hypothetical protein